jgi:outer membrane biosynthesis protein TonB
MYSSVKTDLQKKSDRVRAWTISLLLHALLLLFLILFKIRVDNPVIEAPPITIEWGGGGQEAAAGEPDRGKGKQPAPVGDPTPESLNRPVETPAPPSPAKTPAARANQAPTTNTPTTEDPNVAALRRQQEEERRKIAEQEAQRIANETREAERLKREEEEKSKKKSRFGSSFGGGQGGGQGDTKESGNQGANAGTGTAGQTSGSGGGSGGGSGTGTGVSIGGGLSGRRVVSRPKMTDNSQKQGKVNVEICVNSSGDVIRADYTQGGSTTNDSELRAKAIAWAKQHKFAPSNNDQECGTILFNFQLQ